MKKIRCKVCGHRFHPYTHRRYVAQADPTAFFTPGAPHHDCYGCPMCGCQNPTNLRMKPVDKGMHSKEVNHDAQ